MTKTKVAFFADCLIENFDGAIRTMYEIINRIPQDKFEFLFITGDAPQGQFDHQLYQVPSLSLPVNNNYKMAMTFPIAGRIKLAIENFKPDVIHIATPSPLGHFALRYAQRHDLPVISIYHTHFISYIEYYLRQFPGLIDIAKRVLIAQMQSFYNQCDLLYVPSHQMIAELSQIGVFSSHQHLWQRGIDKKRFSPSKRNVSWIQRLTKNDAPNILFSGRLVWEKNLETLIRVVQKIERSRLKCNFIIAGDGYAGEAMKRRLPNAFFLGHVEHDRLSRIYASSDIFLFPSVSETYGNVVVEAMASGLPCIVGDGGGTKDLVEHDVNGWVCPPNNVDAYISAIQKLLSDEERCQSIRTAGIDYASDLDWQALTDQYFYDVEQLSRGTMLKRA